MNMKAYLVLAASAIAMAATPAFASGPAVGTITLGATVAPACGVGNHRSGAASDPAGDQTPADINLSDSTGQFRTATTVTKSFGNVWCNAPASVTIAAHPLVNSAVTTYDTSSFTNRFDLSVSGGTRGGAFVYTGGGTATSAGTGTPKVGPTIPAFETGLGKYSSVDITVLPSLGSGSQPLRAVAGTYAGSVTFTATIS
jgi:hypothetical protein